MDAQTQLELEAAAYRRLRDHLQNRTDVQNIDMMNLAGFCRNCLSRWYMEEANDKGLSLDKDGAREIVYGMPYGEWREKFQTEANDEKKTKFDQIMDSGEHG
ncbi:MAG: DUF1244 domain-containing protein [Rhodospirillaceae bacterium]|nr:DUF1244 domain-containing protein [Rhodospirillaceae bacterium]MBT4491120.1 DUF1244 domain-containing protein [Rhodospirillaceae bacterium]MBT5192692.1 DUF1244 domain-containing protein [Rhodospirillaceae bacterium]MBT5894335.1 DUF1244 domain-containing protein [Rhodospirillaceae bacterium]MBT7758034.1 DUF1244 domain-containing protein [Rhodospirillaceae bacterium]